MHVVVTAPAAGWLHRLDALRGRGGRLAARRGPGPQGGPGQRRRRDHLPGQAGRAGRARPAAARAARPTTRPGSAGRCAALAGAIEIGPSRRRPAAGARPDRPSRAMVELAPTLDADPAGTQGPAARSSRRRAAPGDHRRARRPAPATSGLPTTDADGAGRAGSAGAAAARQRSRSTWRRSSTRSAVMQTRDALIRVAAECAEDLAADGVVYAEVRFAPELHVAARPEPRPGGRGRAGGLRRRQRGRGIRVYALLTAMRTRGQVAGDRRAGRAAPGRGRGRVRHRGRRGGQPAEPAPGRVPVRRAGELPHHDPRRRGLRAAVDLGGAAVVRRRAARARRPDHRRHQVPPDGTALLGRLAGYVRDRRIPLEMCPTSNVHTGAAAVDQESSDRAAAAAVASGSR